VNPNVREILASIQRQLAAIYRIDTAESAADFLLDERGRARLAARGPVPPGDGQLLVLEEGGDLWLGVYLHDEVRRRLEARDPFERLDRENLDSFLTAVEETSHFLYLVWSLAHGREVTRLELELQGEIDKFVSGALVLTAQRGPSHGSAPSLDRASLARILFEGWTPRPDLDAEESGRYRTASGLAARYCRSLETRYLPRAGGDRIDPLLRELRRFYRRRRAAKFQAVTRQ
jgi:hypothetical protein